MYNPFDTLRLNGRFISVIGSGGKTTLLRALSERLPGTVILTTSTHIYPFPGVPLVETGEAPAARALNELRAALDKRRVACLGQRLQSGKLTAPDLPWAALAEAADWVLVEADGAAGRPLKAHRPWEPVIPEGTTTTICVAGASGLGRPAREVCHCPELFCALAGTSPDAPVRADHVAAVLNREALADLYIVNQVDALPDAEEARRLCALIRGDAFTASLSPR